MIVHKRILCWHRRRNRDGAFQIWRIREWIGSYAGCREEYVHFGAARFWLDVPALFHDGLDRGWDADPASDHLQAAKARKLSDDGMLRYLSPLGWEHINLAGFYDWRQSWYVEEGKFHPLRMDGNP